MAELKAWVLAQAMWDPTQDNQELIEEFLAGYFGPAAQPIGHYLTLLHDSVEKSNTYLNIGVPPSSAYLTLDLMTKAEKLFSEAEALVKDSPDLLNRVQVARLPIRYVWSCRWQDFQLQARKRQLPWPGPADFKANAETFMALCKANDVRMLSEGAGIDSFQARMVDLGRIDSPPPPGCENTPQADWIDYQDAGFTLWQEGTASALKHDDLASDKVAAWMPGTHFEWAIQQTLAGPELDPNATYDVYASVRVEKAGNEGGAFTAGLYDAKSRVGLGQTGAACQDLTTDKYVTYKIDSTKLHEQIYVWVAPVKNPQNVKSVWVDRVWIAKQQR
jgi:hypothetical protein